jgi:hypothetical protein
MSPRELAQMFDLLNRLVIATEEIAVLLANASHRPNTGPR